MKKIAIKSTQLFITIALLLVFFACQSPLTTTSMEIQEAEAKKLKEEQAAAEEETERWRVLGKVALSILTEDFVMISLVGVRPPLRDNAELHAFREKTMTSQPSDNKHAARLRLSPERKGDFIIADIVEGTPEMGDIVYYKSSSLYKIKKSPTLSNSKRKTLDDVQIPGEEELPTKSFESDLEKVIGELNPEQKARGEEIVEKVKAKGKKILKDKKSGEQVEDVIKDIINELDDI